MNPKNKLAPPAYLQEDDGDGSSAASDDTITQYDQNHQAKDGDTESIAYTTAFGADMTDIQGGDIYGGGQEEQEGSGDRDLFEIMTPNGFLLPLLKLEGPVYD